MTSWVKRVDMGGLTLIVDGLRVGATKPGQAGTELTGTEIALLDGITAGTVAASKAVVVDSSKAVSGFTAVGAQGPVGTGATGAGVVTLSTAELTVASATADQLGRIDFQAPLESSGTDAILVAASIYAEAAADFTATANETDLVVALGVSEAASEKHRFTRTGGYVGGAPVELGDVTSYSVLAKNSGRIHVVPNVTSNVTLTLPTAAAGLTYRFVCNLAAAEGQNHIFVVPSLLKGGVVFHDQDGDVSSSVFANGSSHTTLTLVTPEVYEILLVCNGTNWILSGWVHSATTCTIA